MTDIVLGGQVYDRDFIRRSFLRNVQPEVVLSKEATAMSELNLLLEPGDPGTLTPPAHQPDFTAALDQAFAAELTLRYHDYVESIPAIGAEAAYDHFLLRWDAMAEAYNTLLAMIQSGGKP